MNDYSYTFTSVTHPVHLHSGQDALASLPFELQRLGVAKALVLCGRSVHDKTDLIQRITALGGERIAGVFAGITEGSPREDVEAAAELARRLDADCLIAVGAGTVTKAARVIAILLGEQKPLDQLCTRYDEEGRATSVRLMAPKLPIINVLTAATTSQNRAGAAIRDDALSHQLEFFDPKTRPRVIYWDAQALLTAPVSLVKAAAGMEYWWGLMNVAVAKDENPLVQASRYHALRLAQGAIGRIGDAADWRARIDLCAAALLETRDEDDGGKPLGGRPMRAHLLKRAAYMLGVGLFNTASRVNLPAAMIALTGSVIRAFGDLCPDVVLGLGEALGMDRRALESMSAADQTEAVAVAYEQRFAELGYPTNLWSESIPRAEIPNVIQYALRVFNCNADGLMNDKVDRLRSALERAI